MSKRISLALLLLVLTIKVNSQNQDPVEIGTKHFIHSNILNEDREYWVSLPESYSRENSSYMTYPLLILLDGNVHFRSVTGMVNYMSSGYNGNRRVPEMIVVAIQNVNRRRDFTPDKIITKRQNDSGGGRKFLSFLEEELIIELDQKYRTNGYRILFGHSLGGLLAAHSYLQEKSLFNSFIAVDPSFGTWDAVTMDTKLDSVGAVSFNRYLYLATANWGKRNIRNRDRHIRFYEAMNSKCEGEFHAELEYFENENHGSVPILAFHNGISSIFQGYGISYRDIESKEQLVQHFDGISKRLSWEFLPPEYLVNRVGYRMLRSRNENDRSKALEYFLLNTENFPDSFNAYDSLGEAYEISGDKNKAINSYKKSLELNPKNENARMRIEDLKHE